MRQALRQLRRVGADDAPDAFYVQPAPSRDAGTDRPGAAGDVRAHLYVIRYGDFEEALALHNAVPQGLASSIFTKDLREVEIFLPARGSDCGIANINIGFSGAEIGGAFRR
jgi:aldehyde dehydrogenase (NAD+)